MPIRTNSFTTICSGLSNALKSEVTVAKAYIPPYRPPSIVHKKFIAIWDTGATNAVITQKVVRDCGLKPTGMAKIFHADGDAIANTYLVNICLPNKVEVYNVKVSEGKIRDADVLIGMSILSRGDFAVTNKNGKTVFSFRYPSVECIDFVKRPYKEEPYEAPPKISRNAPCPCGSGKKYKYCCLDKGIYE